MILKILSFIMGVVSLYLLVAGIFGAIAAHDLAECVKNADQQANITTIEEAQAYLAILQEDKTCIDSVMSDWPYTTTKKMLFIGG